jgi:peptidoglycan lytic transglycosylase
LSSILARRSARPHRRTVPRRRRRRLVVGLALAGAALVIVLGPVQNAIREVTLPLRHDDIIRQQAHDKGVDAALIAAVIYEESKFRDQTSHAGARGLMQITPRTADFIAHRSGGTAFEQGDLGDPQINIAYGTYYLKYLIDRYGGNDALAIAAYNAGETNVDRWVRAAGGEDDFDVDDDIPFPETRHYVHGVQKHRKQYHDNYADDLGL